MLTAVTQPRLPAFGRTAREDDPSSPALEPAERDAIVYGLLRTPARVAPKYFYDSAGSRLFEAITRTPEYYLTRTEALVMAMHGAAIARAAGHCETVIELGAGSCLKARALCRLLAPGRFVAVDIARDFLESAAGELREAVPGLEVHTVVADLTRAVVLPAALPRARRLVFYPGSSIGNFDPPEAIALLRRARRLLDADGALLIGIDLVKQRSVLEAAYDDRGGVTAAFNRNLLCHLNRLIGSDFDAARWRHVALYDDRLARIEMHLEAVRDQRVCWPGGSRRYAAGERIHTENSHKHSLPSFGRLLAEGGFSRWEAWRDPRDWFAVVLARP